MTEMQTFLPYPDFHKSVRCLDPKRLGNQVYREALTLLRGGWPHHPASKMWRGYEYALCKYCIAGLQELFRRGRHYPNHFHTFNHYMRYKLTDTGLPPWLGDRRLHRSHKAALLYKDYNWYSRFGWKVPPAIPDAKGKLPYYWPVQ